MPLFTEAVYFPRRYRVNKKVFKNPIYQLEQAGGVENVGVEVYDRRGIKGWAIQRSGGEQVLVVGRKTTANPFDSVLVLPGANTLPRSRRDLPKGWRWAFPKSYQQSSTDLPVLCAETRESWDGAFQFLEERRSDNELIPGLRQPQIGALYASLAHWRVTSEIATVVMPTGTGKTETMLALLAKERFKHLLVVVPTSPLRDQIAEKFLTFGILQEAGVIDSNASLPVVGKIEHRFDTPEDAAEFIKSCNVAIATMSVLSRCKPQVQLALAASCSHLFIDEAHHVPARTWSTFRDLVGDQGQRVLQFTATPFRRDGKPISGKSIFTYPMKNAQKEGYFTRINFVSIWEYDNELSDLKIAQRAIEALRQDLRSGHDHILMARTNTIDRAQYVYEEYLEQAPDLMPLMIHHDLKPSQRAESLKALRSRESRIVVCVDMLGEGFDLPQLKIAALHDIHKSLAVTIQFAGRFTRTASGIGEATIVANAANTEVELALEDLYAKDSDWNIVLRRLSEGATGQEQRRSAFLEGFQVEQAGIPLQSIRPKMSTVVYRTFCKNWEPGKLKNFLKSVELLQEPILNPKERVILYITKERRSVAWGATKSVTDLNHDLYLAFWSEDQQALFINSTNNKSTHLQLARQLCGSNVALIRGEKIYRCLYGLNRLILSNLGLLHLLSRATQFTMHVGSDIKEGLSRAAVSNRKKSNLFSRGYEGGESVTLGASHKGRVWSHKVAAGVSEWVDWSKQIGSKLLDETISTEKILEHVIIPEVLAERPNLVPLSIEWPHYFLKRSEEAVQVVIDDHAAPFYEAALEIATFTESGPIGFYVKTDAGKVDFSLSFKDKSVEYRPSSGRDVYILVSGQKKRLNEWFQAEPPVITFEDTSKLEYNEIFRPKNIREPFDSTRIERWKWSGVDLTKESQYRSQKSPRLLVHRTESVQHHLIQELLANWGPDYDIIFDDDGTGEVADVVALKAAGDRLLVHLFHCKYSKSSDAGVRVNDFYEVCGQAQKSVFWRSQASRLFDHLGLREAQRYKTYGVSRFERGDIKKLDELRKRSRALYFDFQIWIVQPGLNSDDVGSAILDLLGATELYLQDTFAVPLGVIGSP